MVVSVRAQSGDTSTLSDLREIDLGPAPREPSTLPVQERPEPPPFVARKCLFCDESRESFESILNRIDLLYDEAPNARRAEIVADVTDLIEAAGQGVSKETLFNYLEDVAELQAEEGELPTMERAKEAVNGYDGTRRSKVRRSTAGRSPTERRTAGRR